MPGCIILLPPGRRLRAVLLKSLPPTAELFLPGSNDKRPFY